MHKNAEVQICIRGSKVENASSVICLLLFFAVLLLISVTTASPLVPSSVTVIPASICAVPSGLGALLSKGKASPGKVAKPLGCVAPPGPSQ